MKPETFFCAVAVATMMALSACESPDAMRPIVKEPEAPDHAHIHKHIQGAGDYHVMSFMKRRSNVIGIQILDRHEEPFYLDRPRIKAEITLPGKAPEIVWLVGERYGPPRLGLEDYGNQAGATMFTRRYRWVEKAHEARIRVWVPLPDGKIHELAFTCSAKDAVAAHSGVQ